MKLMFATMERRWRVWLALLLLAVRGCGPVLAALDIPSDGSDGDLVVDTDRVIDLGLAVTGSWDSDNALNGGNGIYDPEKWAVVFKYSSVTIRAGATVTFKNHPSRAPVVWLVSGEVLIDGAVNLDGQRWQWAPVLAEPGPGGFRGGSGHYLSAREAGSGFGPGGGRYLAGGSHGSEGKNGPATYGSLALLPLIGGSGGGARVGDKAGGGAGGGALLIACSTRLSLNGTISANGGDGADVQHTHASGGGSGGALRLVSENLEGSGSIFGAGGGGGTPGGFGRIRIERATQQGNLTINPEPSVVAAEVGGAPVIWAPDGGASVRIFAVGGETAPSDPRAEFGAHGADVVVSGAASMTIVVETRNLEEKALVTVTSTPRTDGRSIEARAELSEVVNEDPAVIRWTALLPVSQGYSTVLARAVQFQGEAVSREVSLVVATPEVPAPVTGEGGGFAAVGSSRSLAAIDLSWPNYDEPAQRDVVGYRIYLEPAPYEDVTGREPHALVAGETWSHTLQGLDPGKHYEVAVVAEDVLGQWDPVVRSVSAKASIGELGEVSGLAVASGETSLRFVWGAPEGAEAFLDRYHFYFAGSKAPEALAPGTTVYEVENLLPAHAYPLRITTVDRFGRESDGTSLEAATWLENPTVRLRESLDGAVRLAWEHVEPLSLMRHYRVYRSDTPFTSVEGLTPVLTTRSNEAVVGDLVSGETYYFGVTAVNLAHGERPEANAISASPNSGPRDFADLAILWGFGDTAVQAGQFVHYSWWVRNAGLGRTSTGEGTPVDGWLDRVVLSPNAVHGDADDLVVGEVRRREGLGAGKQYVATARVRIPDLAPGTYSLFFFADAEDVVHEAPDTGENVWQMVGGLAVLAEQGPPEILIPPVGGEVALGMEVLLTVVADGEPPLGYQWRLNGENIPGATERSYFIPEVGLEDAGTYTVAVSNSGGVTESSPAVLSIRGLVDLALADDFANRPVFHEATLVGRADNSVAGVQTAEPRHAGKTGGRSLWMTWVAPANGIARFSTTGSSFDTLLGVYTGLALNALIEVASGEDRGGYLTSALSFNARAGQEYHVAVDGFAGAGGDVVLRWELERTTLSQPIITRQPESVLAIEGQSLSLTIAADDPSATFQWFRNDELLPGADSATLNLATVGRGEAGMYRARVTGANGQSVLSQAALVEVVLEATGATGQELSADKWEDLFTEDELGGLASARAGLKRSASPKGFTWLTVGARYTDLSGATRSPNDPLSCDRVTGASRWYRFRTAGAQAVPVEVRVDQNDEADVVLGVYTNRFSLTQVRCDVGPRRSGGARVWFPAQPEVDYLVMVAAVGEASGGMRLSWENADATEVLETEVEITEGKLLMQWVVPPGRYDFQVTGDLSAWPTSFQTNVTSGLFLYQDPDPPVDGMRFYNLRLTE